jgi:hypothetical protein
MHDWTLDSISIDWQSGSVVCRLQGPNAPASLVAHGLRELRLPRTFEWGPSVSVNRLTGPVTRDDGLLLLSIEMQSGDTIEIEASSFQLPAPQS